MGARLLRDAPLPGPVRAVVAAAREQARSDGTKVYLVGGLVRDLILGRVSRDLDLAVAGDGPRFAAGLARRLGGELQVHEAFGTAHLALAEGVEVDVAGLRRETYAAPAALPQVEAGSLREDLVRRDFTVNAIALELGPTPEEDELLDPFRGHEDIGREILSVLHPESFLDDPTRILRGVGLEVRLGFSMSEPTERAARAAVAAGVFEALSGTRLRDALVRLLDDAEVAVAACERLADLEVLRTVHPALRLSDDDRRRLRAFRRVREWWAKAQVSTVTVLTWRVFLIGLSWRLTAEERGELGDRLVLQGREREVVVGCRARVAAAADRLRQAADRPSAISAALADLGGEDLLALMAVGTELEARSAESELAQYRALTLDIGGADLLAAGFDPGVSLGAALEATRRARLDGEIASDQELDFACRYLRGAGAGRGGS